MKFMGQICGLLSVIFAKEIVSAILFLVWGAGCFLAFDRFHITNLAAQVFLVITPFLALAFWLVRTGRIKR